MKSPGVRKGAWSTDEDLLLKRCIEMHGEGKWHLVPQRAGLNRCRKSCRLRWLNYLQPNLNKEEFKEDEIDLIIKMHKLLGNRWSLIAGRLPGRTANDIKNYWNSNLRKKLSSNPNGTQKRQPKMKRYEVIRPQPRYFNSKVLSHGQTTANTRKPQQHEEKKNLLCMLAPSEQLNMWWDELLVEDGKYSTDTNEEIILKDHTVEGSVETMDPERVKFDCNALEWDDLLNMNTWLMT